MARRRLRVAWAILGLLVFAVILAAGGYLLYEHTHPAPLIPKNISDKASYVVFYPSAKITDTTEWHIEKSGTAYSTDTGVLTMVIVHDALHRKIILKQQALPGTFSDVPTLYSKMLTSLNEYGELQTDFGTVALTHPKELNGGQTAVVNKSGTLMFAQPSADLTDNQWQSFFESLQILRS